MKITVCIGSSCHVRGSRQIVEKLQNLIKENNISETVELCGTFCMGKCQENVSVSIDDKYFSVTPDTAEKFFNENVLNALKQKG